MTTIRFAALRAYLVAFPILARACLAFVLATDLTATGCATTAGPGYLGVNNAVGQQGYAGGAMVAGGYGAPGYFGPQVPPQYVTNTPAPPLTFTFTNLSERAWVVLEFGEGQAPVLRGMVPRMVHLAGSTPQMMSVVRPGGSVTITFTSPGQVNPTAHCTMGNGAVFTEYGVVSVSMVDTVRSNPRFTLAEYECQAHRIQP